MQITNRKLQICKNGFTLVEVIVGTFLILIVFLGIFGAYELGLKVVGQAKARIIAISVANEQLEKIRNLPYESVGIVAGYPSGIFPSSTTALQNNIEFTIEYQIQYEIDPKDGIDCDPVNAIPDDQTYRLSLDDYDCCPNDYKKIKVKVFWQGNLGGEIEMNSVVAPKNSEEECGEKGGLLKVEVDNQEGNKVESPNIKVTRLTTGFNWTKQPVDGAAYFLLEPASSSDYRIEVSKSGYSSSQTYGIGEVYQGQTIITPDHFHVALSEGELEEHSFFIDKLSKFLIQTLEAKSEHIYYVRKTGNDENDGLSSETAFLTIQKAASTTRAGDIVFVGSGIYDEEITIYNSGTAAEPIAFVADYDGTYTGDSGEVKIQGPGKNYGFYISDKTDLKIYGFKIENSSISAIYIAGATSKNIEIINNIISNNTGDGIYLTKGSDVTLSHNLIYSNNRGIYLDDADSNNLVKNTVYQNSSDGIRIENSGSIVLNFNSSFSNGGSGILISDNSNNCQLTNNTTYFNIDDGIQVSNNCNSIEVSNNKSYSNPIGSGISFKNISNTNTISSNLVYANQRAGILLSDNCVNNTISNNTSFQNQENGILIEDSSDNEIRDNIIASSTLAGIKVATSTNIESTYNNVWGNSPDYDGITAATGSISVESLFVDPDGPDNILGGNNGEDDNFHLSQIAAGQATTSSCVDVGSDLASNLGMDDKTTKTDSVLDSGLVDMGFHYSLESAPAIPPAPDPFGVAVPNTAFYLRGEKTVGKDVSDSPIYKYSATSTTNASGQLTSSDLEWDNYHFSNFKSVGISLDLIASYPFPAIGGETNVYLAPDATTTVKLGLKAENTLLVKVLDASSNEPIFAAGARVYAAGYDTTKPTNTNGEVYFIPLEKISYNLEVAAIGYATSTSNVFVNGHIQKTINLTE